MIKGHFRGTKDQFLYHHALTIVNVSFFYGAELIMNIARDPP